MLVKTFNKLVRAEFNKAFSEAPKDRYNKAYTEVPSNQEYELYEWLGSAPVISEWLGGKKIKTPKDYNYTIRNKDFEGTLAVDRNAIEDDRVGIIKPRIQDLALRAKNFPSRLVSDLIINGDTNKAYDGNAFFANRGTNDNLLAGTGTTESAILTDLATARKTMLQFVDDEGEVLEIEGDTVVCPVDLEPTFMKIVKSSTYITASASGVANVWAGIIKNVIVDPRLTDSNDWYLLATGYPLRPFIYQNRKPAKLVALTDEEASEMVFMYRKLLYSVELRGNAGYGFYQMAVKMVNA